MPIISDLQSLSHDSEIELFELRLPGGDEYSYTIYYFCNHYGVNFANEEYLPISCEIEGISYTSEGSAPRPKLRVLDKDLIISTWIHDHEGLEGSVLTIKKTLKRYTDFGSSPDSSAIKTTDVYTISHRSQEIPGKVIEFELVSAFDFVNEILPNRRCMIKCPWIYKSAECGYDERNGGFTIGNQPTYDPDEDVCAKSLTACTKRFGKTAVLPYGGFPALGRF
jgi:lambda family phage minor tail protein L